MFCRSYCSRRLAISQPPFSWPTRFSLGIFTSVKKVSQNGLSPRDQLDRPRLDAGRRHVDQHEARCPRASRRRVGAHQAEAPVGLVGVAGPDLLAVDQPVVALVLAAGLQAGEVGAGAGLGIALAPADLAAGRSSAGARPSAPRWRTPAAPAPASRCRTRPAAGGSRRGSSCSTIRASSGVRPPPPYFSGQVGAVQPRDGHAAHPDDLRIVGLPATRGRPRPLPGSSCWRCLASSAG